MKSKHYSLAQIGLHWWVALLFGANYIVSDGMGPMLGKHLEGQDVSQEFVVNFHVYVGLAFLGFALLRIVVRLFSGAPEPVETANKKLDKLALIAHKALYVLMLLVPLAGIGAWYGNIHELGDVHVIIMNVMLGLVGLHIVGALYHRFVLKDGVIERMSFLRRS
ncbi:cytochrome b [Maribrevibacterium harenarium]|uniref:Cytochrome b n=1 Tax=Maribrevibacterium harenarium TaxID=2589817 RepID=A0A501WRK8_9GAMM|nr:cytochrome b/b6 domain-containing protein [Maribrevibacterium harenarium]TPE52393.1 cytochrome b [Maribrevibacterium harenarium]